MRLPCARHLRTAPCVTVSAGDSLEGGHSLQPLHTSLLRRASQNGGAHGAGGGRSPAPFCARREICQRGIPPPRMQLTAKPAGGSRARGDHVTREVDGAPHPHPRRRVLSVFSKGSLRGRGGDGGGRQRRPAAGCSGDSRRGDGGPGIRRDRGVVRCEAAWPLVRAGERGGPGSGSAESRRRQRRTRGPKGVTVGTKAGAWHRSRRSGDLGLYVNGSRWTSERPSVPLCGGQACLALIAKSRDRVEG